MTRKERREKGVAELKVFLDDIPAMDIHPLWVSTLLGAALTFCVLMSPLVMFGALVLNAGKQVLKLLVSPFVAFYVMVDTWAVLWWFFAEMKRRLER